MKLVAVSSLLSVIRNNLLEIMLYFWVYTLVAKLSINGCVFLEEGQKEREGRDNFELDLVQLSRGPIFLQSCCVNNNILLCFFVIIVLLILVSKKQNRFSINLKRIIIIVSG